jgi:hypothetical protein
LLFYYLAHVWLCYSTRSQVPPLYTIALTITSVESSTSAQTIRAYQILHPLLFSSHVVLNATLVYCGDTPFDCVPPKAG